MYAGSRGTRRMAHSNVGSHTGLSIVYATGLSGERRHCHQKSKMQTGFTMDGKSTAAAYEIE